MSFTVVRVDDFYKPAMSGVYDIAGGIFTTGHFSTNMQIENLGDEATTLAYFSEIVANDTILIGTYQHRMRRDPDRWRFHRLRITVGYHAGPTDLASNGTADKMRGCGASSR